MIYTPLHLKTHLRLTQQTIWQLFWNLLSRGKGPSLINLPDNYIIFIPVIMLAILFAVFCYLFLCFSFMRQCLKEVCNKHSESALPPPNLRQMLLVVTCIAFDINCSFYFTLLDHCKETACNIKTKLIVINTARFKWTVVIKPQKPLLIIGTQTISCQ